MNSGHGGPRVAASRRVPSGKAVARGGCTDAPTAAPAPAHGAPHF
eukprot:CAMPEP_0170408378 /NCGR_PEP_ID=MMETSP0117_2-20130122/28758_1 /TAXON_ID=400756 /ORGANISM="Durinskia baltica, Strain CSIRO CS-38" /LENGTH=44 /DNA_ID= /DNA_START= /DNA_END= /DNA_ORIENTATION=